MAGWLRPIHTQTVSSVNVHSNLEVFHNQRTADRAAKAAYGVRLFVMGSGSVAGELWIVRLLIVHESITPTNAIPDLEDPKNWATFPVSDSPAYFDIRSKREIAQDEKLWLQTYKAVGTASNLISVMAQIYLVQP